MRMDMSKVLVEEPRRGRAFARVVEGSRRKARNRLARDGESGPMRRGMRRDPGVCKSFGEHLGPLYAYLRKQVNRPWSKVYGELCASLDRRSVVHAHLFQHIHDKVATETLSRDGQVWVRNLRALVPLEQSFSELYVHPATDILLVNRARIIATRKRKEVRLQKIAARKMDRMVDIPGQPSSIQWHRVDGLWYAVTMVPFASMEPDGMAYDVVLGRLVSAHDRELLNERFGFSSAYAFCKRQLDGDTLRRDGLTNA